MNKKQFNPQDWQNKSTPKSPEINQGNLANLNKIKVQTSDIEEITQRIESTTTDIAPTYPDWRDLGFALADALGESGRTYYHRLSRFYPNYTEKETTQQFNKCLKSHGHGITIKTLYHLAKSVGIDISSNSQQPNNQGNQVNPINQGSDILPTFPETIYSMLPDFLQQITNYANSREDADLLLLGSLVVISACLPNVYGIYGGVIVYPNLFLFVSAQASAGKGRLSLCRRLVEPIHRQLRELNKLEQEEYRRQQVEYAANKKKTDAEQPQEPPLRLLFIPANSSATAVFQILNDNQGVGLIFETEGDTMAQTFKTEHGNYSDGFRKAFHHEKISYLRRKDREYVTLEIPKLSALLSGTPRQVQSLIPDAENGLFSRFMFYYMNIRLQWIDVFACNGNESLDQRFNRFGEQFFDFYNSIKQYESLRFSLSNSQQTQFNQYFEKIQQQYWELMGNDYIGTIRRLGLITFRIAMILTTLRLMETTKINQPIKENHGNLENLNKIMVKTLFCSDTDFQIAMEIVKGLLQHATFVFHQLPATGTAAQTTNPKMALFQALPSQFDRAKYVEVAAQLQIPESTANKQIARFLNAGLLTRQAHGNYAKKES